MQYQLGYHLQIGDTILTHFDSLPGSVGPKVKEGKAGCLRGKNFQKLSFDKSEFAAFQHMVQEKGFDYET